MIRHFGMKGGQPPIETTKPDLLNKAGYDIFWVVNEFEGPRRLAKNLTKINYWFIEVDDVDKETQLRTLKNSPLRPSLIVESKRGFHAYWRAKEATLENWRPVMSRLVNFFSSDPKATDPLRLLRAPGFYHLKDPEDPFFVGVVWESEVEYAESRLLLVFQPSSKHEPAVSPTFPVGTVGSGGFWHTVGQLRADEALLRLSGHWLCNGEMITLASLRSNGTRNVIVNGKETGLFIGQHGRLHGMKLGTSIATWVKWYGWEWRTIAEEFKKLFPALGEQNADEATEEHQQPSEHLCP